MAQVDIKDSTIKIKDGGSNYIEVKVGEGTLKWTEKRNLEFNKDRGLLDNVRTGDEEPVELSIDSTWEWLRSSGSETVTPYEAVKKIGGATSWATAGSDACAPYCVDIEVTITKSCEGGTETITFSEFYYETLECDLRAGTLTLTGKCNETEPTSARS